jgi:hypothetical protein
MRWGYICRDPTDLTLETGAAGEPNGWGDLMVVLRVSRYLND